MIVNSGSEVVSMIGDTNIYFINPNDRSMAEIEIMIGEEDHRGKGKGKEALLLMIRFVIDLVKIEKLIAKIKIENEVSRKLFESLGFVQQEKSDFFQEVTYIWIKDDSSNLVNILQSTNHIQYKLL